VELGIFQDCKKVKSYGEKPEDFEKLLNEMEEEAERRLKLFTSVRKKHYIQKLSVWNKYYPEQALPYKVCIIDEFARLAEKDYEDLLEKFRNRVAMDRKTGILYIASMQRPDVKIISGSIKGSMSTRIAFKTVTDTDSEVILDVEGAEKIKNQGRCLMKYLGEMKEVQCLYIEPEDVRSILKKHKAFKTVEDQQREKQEYLKKWREQNINPYAKGV
jgi:S-DNA-T family DNA segregation ATPase FtsK/SpoIIIE